MKKKISKKKLALIITAAAIVLLTAVLWITAVMIYNENFDKRFETYEPQRYYVEDFEGLTREEYSFTSDKGQKLAGYMYTAENTDGKGIVVMAHGFGGGGHNSYMDVINFFAHRGYYVFAYDATACDESEGDGVGGLPQGVIDLDHALDFVEQSGNFPELPIVLFGHSWGGYSACNVLSYHPEVKAVAECSGWNKSSDMFEAEVRRQAGAFIDVLMPFVKLHEYIKYGEYAENTALDGFAASDAAVMVIHSTDDNVVPFEKGFGTFEEKYKDDPRFTFVRYEDKGHSYICLDRKKIDKFNEGFDTWRDGLGYDIEKDKERFADDKAGYFYDHHEEWCDMLDEEMFADIADFYDTNIA